MNDADEIRQILRPITRNWWLVLSFSIAGLIYGYNRYEKMPPSFQARSGVQINDVHSSSSTFLKGIESFSLVGEYTVEMTLMRSDFLIQRAYRRLDVKTSWYVKEGKIQRDLYKQSPFILDYALTDSSRLDQSFGLMVENEKQYTLSFLDGEMPIALKGSWGDTLNYDNFQFQISLNLPYNSDWEDEDYSFIINSEEALLELFTNHDNILVRPQEEKASIVNIYYWHQNPALATDFVNIMARTYMDDFLEKKIEFAQRALKTIDEQVKAAENKIIDAEIDLINFKQRTGVHNVSTFKGNLKDQLVELNFFRDNLRFKIADLERQNELFSDSLRQGKPILNFNSLSDRLFKEMLEKLEMLQHLHDWYRQSFHADHPSIANIEAELRSMKQNIRSSIDKTLKNQRKQLVEMDKKIADVRQKMTQVPALDQEMNRLLEQIAIRQDLFDTLIAKRTLAAISASSDAIFHRILEFDLTPEIPIKPIMNISMGVSCLVFTILGCFFVHILKMVLGVPGHKQDIENQLDIPVQGIAGLPPPKKPGFSQGIVNMAAEIILDKDKQVVTLASFSKEKTKGQTAYQLASAMAAMGVPTLFVMVDQDSDASDFQAKNQLEIIHFSMDSTVIPADISRPENWDERLDSWRKAYEQIVLCSPPLKKSREALPLMRNADLTIVPAQLRRTPIKNLLRIKTIFSEFQIKQTSILILTGRHRQTMYQY